MWTYRCIPIFLINQFTLTFDVFQCVNLSEFGQFGNIPYFFSCLEQRGEFSDELTEYYENLNKKSFWVKDANVDRLIVVICEQGMIYWFYIWIFNWTISRVNHQQKSQLRFKIAQIRTEPTTLTESKTRIHIEKYLSFFNIHNQKEIVNESKPNQKTNSLGQEKTKKQNQTFIDLYTVREIWMKKKVEQNVH